MFAVASLWSHGHKIIWYTKISEARHVQVRFDNDLGCRIDARLLRPHTSFAWNYSQQTLSPNTPCPKISVHLYVFWITLCQKFTDFNDFSYMKSWETLISKFPILPVNCSHFTLGNSKKVVFNNTANTYFGLFASSHNKTNCNRDHVATWMSSKQRHSKCSNLLHMLPVFFSIDQSHRLPHSAGIQPVSQQAAAATRPYRGLVGTR